MHDILKKIVAAKRQEIAEAKNKIAKAELLSQIKNMQPRSFANAIIEKHKKNEIALIAEIKKASPSKGIIRENFNVADLAKQYELGGATCLSVLTDEKFFMGHIDFLQQAKQATALPILRKDFMLEPYQVFQARAFGADCILIIMAMVEDDEAKILEQTAQELKMDVIIEVHNEIELNRALKLDSKLIGINNRDLSTFETDLAITRELGELVPNDRIVISESGFSNAQQLFDFKKLGISTFLIGETLMKCDNVTQATKEILGNE